MIGSFPVNQQLVPPGDSGQPRLFSYETILLNAKKDIFADVLFLLISGLFLPAVPANRDRQTKQKEPTICMIGSFQLISSFLSSQAASSQVLSAFVSLTTVFGMGTGVSSQLSPLNL